MANNGSKKTTGAKKGKELPVLPVLYDCTKCPAYCCTYDWIVVNKRDIQRLANGFELSYEEAENRFTKYVKEYGRRVLRHRQDDIFKSACQFLHPTERRCTIYKHRPTVCREYPDSKRCRYYEFIKWERDHQDDEKFIPLQK